MNEAQFKILAEQLLRKPAQRLAAYDAMFGGLNHSQAERAHGCSGGSVRCSIKSINTYYDLHVRLMGVM